MSSKKLSIIQGSERSPVRGARVIRNANPDQVIEVSVRLRPKSPAEHTELRKALMSPSRDKRVRPISRRDYEVTHGASPEDLAKIKQFAAENSLKVMETGNELARRTVVLSGTVANLQKAFGVELKEYSHPSGNFRGRLGSLSIPSDYADIIEGVFGLDDRPQAFPHNRRMPRTPGVRALSVQTSHDPNEVGRLYNFPTNDGSGQCIGMIELGGGFGADDLNTYFGSVGIKEPQVISVPVDGGKNHPSTPDSDDGEVMLDIEVAGAVAPGAKIAVYFAPNTDRGFLDALTTAIHDDVNQPSVISISWGAPEPQWTDQAKQQFDQALQSAAALGINVCCASGDNGSSDGLNDGNNHVDFPASSPFALACGGTTLQSSNGTIVKETVWNNQPTGGATGGGVSSFFPRPDYQSDIGSLAGDNVGRGVPDVSGDADPHTGYNILVDGEQEVFGGTSAVAPLWAALIAQINQKAGGPVGFLNPILYSLGSKASAFRDIVSGTNGFFSAASGWDPCTGLGSPDGARLVDAITGTTSAAASAGAAAKSAVKKPAA